MGLSGLRRFLQENEHIESSNLAEGYDNDQGLKAISVSSSWKKPPIELQSFCGRRSDWSEIKAILFDTMAIYQALSCIY